MALTKIEWADCTFNPWWGCERVSPACAHCYADTFAIRLGMKTLWPKGGNKITAGAPHAFRFFGDKHWDEPLKWARTLPAKLGRRPRVFCASMADVFEERDELRLPRARLVELIIATPELDWLVLTKRPEFARDYLTGFYGKLASAAGADTCSPLENIWLGVSIENARYTWRADVLRQIPAAVRFISAEPLLGSLYQTSRIEKASCPPAESMHGRGGYQGVRSAAGARKAEIVKPVPSPNDPGGHSRAPLDLSGIDWVIIGGESGPKARPFHLEHAREIIEATYDRCDCEHIAHHHRGSDCGSCTKTAVFVKQLGAKPIDKHFRASNVYDLPDLVESPLKLRDRKGGDMDEWPADLRIREFPRTAVLA